MAARISNVELLNRASLEVDILDRHGATLSSGVKLQMLGGGSFEAKLLAPTQKFKIALKGRTKRNYEFKRLSNRFSEAQSAVMVVVSAGEEFTASVSGGGSKIIAYMYNQEDADQFTFQGVANYGSISADTASVTIQKASNTTVEFTYRLHSSASLHVGKTDTVVLKAIGARGAKIYHSTDLLVVA